MGGNGKIKMNEFVQVCQNTCLCEFCKEKIKKGEPLLIIWKSAWKGNTRTNTCKTCIVKMFLELNLKRKEVEIIKKELILNALQDK